MAITAFETSRDITVVRAVLPTGVAVSLECLTTMSTGERINRFLFHLLRVSIPAASRAIGQLVEAKVLVERTGYARNRIFAAPEALTVLKRTYGTQPRLPQR